MISKLDVDLTPTLTVDEFEKLPEFDDRYELLDGRLPEKPMPIIEHSQAAKVLMRRLAFFDPDETLGELLTEVSVVLNIRNVPAPDLAFWVAANRPPKSRKAAPLPDLAIEIWSPHDTASRKRKEEAMDKVRRYQSAGVRMVWIVNPTEQKVFVYHQGTIEPGAILGIGDELSGGEVIPGFKLPVKDLFE